MLLAHSGHVESQVPPDAIDPLDHEEFAPGTAVFVQDPPPDLKRELLKCCRPMYDPNRPDQLCFPGLMAERHTDSASWVTFRAGKLLVPNRCLQPQHATKPAQPAPKPARLLPGQPVAFGFGYLDFVRDRNGNKGHSAKARYDELAFKTLEVDRNTKNHVSSKPCSLQDF